MRGLTVGLLCLCVAAVACSASPARLGSLYADVYGAFAPLYVLYRSYADHLFSGAPVRIPPSLESSCERYSYELAVFHVEYVQQTGSATVAGLARLVRLRVESSAFCDSYDEWIRTLADPKETDADLLSAASEEGLFSAIKQLNDSMGEALDEILAGLGDGIERWTFAVTFSVRALLRQTEVDRIDANLREILYADPNGTAPPFDVPAEIVDAMEQLVGLAGRDLSEAEAAEAYRLATAIYEHFVAAR